MDDLVKRAIKTAESKKKTSVPWDMDKPWKQPSYVFSSDQNKWISSNPSDSNNSNNASTNISKLALYSWNIDFMLPHADSRMTAALRHLQSSHIDQNKPQTASVVFLQECVESDLRLLAADPWVRRTFALTDLDVTNWQSAYYGTCTLVDLRLSIANCFRVHYSQTRMERDGLFVDVRVGGDNGPAKTLRLCNTHLESLALEPAYRPPQMELVARYMKDTSVNGALVAGDFNAIQDFDLRLHSDNGLRDAFLELGGSEGDAEGGHTWGQQAATVQRERFGTSRMDKVFFCGSVRCSQFERFGGGVELEDERERREIVQLGFDRPWITDHLGVKGVFELVDESAGGKSSL